jgi:hypothetical protein
VRIQTFVRISLRCIILIAAYKDSAKIPVLTDAELPNDFNASLLGFAFREAFSFGHKPCHLAFGVSTSVVFVNVHIFLGVFMRDEWFRRVSAPVSTGQTDGNQSSLWTLKTPANCPSYHC